MKFFAGGLVAILILVAGTEIVSAACTKPVGIFVGSGSGIAYDRPTGNIVNVAGFTLSVTVAPNGAMNITEVGKDYVSGVYNASSTVARTNHTFNATTCRGTVTTSNGKNYTYTVAAGGTVVTFVYTTNDNLLALYNIRLEKI